MTEEEIDRSEEEEERIWRERGFAPVEAHTLEKGDIVLFKDTDIFQLESVGSFRTGVVFEVRKSPDTMIVEVDHDDRGGDATTTADWEDEVWVKRKEAHKHCWEIDEVCCIEHRQGFHSTCCDCEAVVPDSGADE